MTESIWDVIIDSFETIGISIEALDELAALSMQDKKIVTEAVITSVEKSVDEAKRKAEAKRKLAIDKTGDTSSEASQTGARASNLRPLGLDGPPGSGYPDGAYDSGARVLPDHE